MSLPIPLTITLTTSAGGSRTITKDVRNLTMRWSDPGGFASCTVTLDRPLAVQPEETGYYATLAVHDARNGVVAWEGRLEDPGRKGGGSDGEVWELAAMGGQAHTHDRTIPLIYVDRRMDPWVKLRSASSEQQSTTVNATEDAAGTGEPAVVLAFPPGLAVNTGSACTAGYLLLDNAGQNLAVFDYRWDAGVTNASWQLIGYSAGAHQVRFNSLSTSGGGTNAMLIGVGAFAVGDHRPILRLEWQGASSSTGSSDDIWVSVMDIAVRTTTYSKIGVEKTSGYAAADTKILASTVVEDLLGRLLTKYDGAGAVVTATTHPIEQLAYPDGVDANKVLSDLLALESGYSWRVWERNNAGLYRFEFVPVPTAVRYESDIADGYESTGSADGLYNKVTVRWIDPRGFTRSTTRTSTVAELDSAGLTRQGFVDLGSDGSLADAQQAGDQFLADHAAAPNAGRLRIARPILDLQSGRMVQPWEIRPGLIRVRGILPRQDAINTGNRDGVTVFRIVGCEYSASDGAATLELDSYPASLSAVLAQLTKANRYRRR